MARTLLVSPRTPGWAISEVRQRHALASLESVRDDELDTLLASAYSDTGSAAAVVGAAESEVDLDRLMDDIPEVTDLLDTQDGRASDPHDQRAADPGGAR
ncbi:type II secretion system protein [Pseudomonas aeruginosa]|nr:type II secretion system protein [Pseudomonas aeruginosa]